ncbi:MAG: RluA family pseudouridine synthase [bacterium]
MMETPEVLFENEDIIAINKPAGLVVHPAPQQAGCGASSDGTSVSEWFVEHYPQSKNVGEPVRLSSGQEIERPGIVHRIDRETSGVLLLAKTDKGHQVLKKQFQNREIEKIYHLFVYGNVKDDRGTINLPIGKSPRDFRKWSAERGAKGEMREAITYFEVLKRSPEEGVTLVEAKPKTGRTHQIRVHFRALQRPILGDKLYGPKIAPRNLGEVGHLFKRLALHARSLTFKDVSGEIHQITAEYPEDFQKALKTIDFKP